MDKIETYEDVALEEIRTGYPKAYQILKDFYEEHKPRDYVSAVYSGNGFNLSFSKVLDKDIKITLEGDGIGCGQCLDTSGELTMHSFNLPITSSSIDLVNTVATNISNNKIVLWAEYFQKGDKQWLQLK